MPEAGAPGRSAPRQKARATGFFIRQPRGVVKGTRVRGARLVGESVESDCLARTCAGCRIGGGRKGSLRAVPPLRRVASVGWEVSKDRKGGDRHAVRRHGACCRGPSGEDRLELGRSARNEVHPGTPFRTLELWPSENRRRRGLDWFWTTTGRRRHGEVSSGRRAGLDSGNGFKDREPARPAAGAERIF